MDPNVIKEFLISVGFDLDTNSQRRFVDGINQATKLVLGLAGALTGLVAATTAAAAGMERLYFVSQRTQASVAGIKSLQYAVTNLGGSADDALGSIEGIAKFIRSNPGGEGFIGALGVGTRNSAGQLRDTVDILADLGKQFAAMPYYQAAKRASLLGIDEKTLQALIAGVGQFSDEYRKMTAAVGYNSDAAAKASHEFMVQVRGLWGELGILSDKFFSTFAEKLTPVIERARKWIEANAGLIAQWIDRIVTVLGVLAKIVATVVTRAVEIFSDLYNAFDRLDPVTKHLAEILLGVYAALRLIVAVFTASPLGAVLALASALLLLYDDYKTFKEGGQTLIDWDKWAPGINAAIEGIKTLVGWLDEAFEKTKKLSDQVFGGTSTGDKIGEWATYLAAGLGSKEAQKTLDEAATLAGGGRLTGSYAAARATGSGNQPTNPGNIRNGPGGAITNYGSPAEGLQALGRQLNLYATGKSRNTGGRSLDTIQDIISTYAPPNENNTSAYIADVSQRMGVKPTDRLNLSDPDTLASLMRGITIHEQGRNPYSNQQFRDAATTTLGGAAANVDQTNNYYIDGAKDARAVGKEVQGAQNVTNQRLARNLSTAAQ